MSYNPTNWIDGDISTPKRMNHLENGVSELYGMLVSFEAHPTVSGCYISNKTWQEITDSMRGGRLVFLIDPTNGLTDSIEMVLGARIHNNGYEILVSHNGPLYSYSFVAPNAKLILEG